MKFVVNGIAHEGFQRVSKPTDVVAGEHTLVFAWFDGELDLWVVNSHAGFRALQKYYTDQWGPHRVIYRVFHLTEKTDESTTP